MIVVKLKGGLGNQLFQYAFAFNLSKILNKKIYIDITYFKEINFDTKRSFELSNYPIQYDGIISSRNLIHKIYEKLTSFKITESNFDLSKVEIYKQQKKITLDGYWQSVDFFFEYAGDVKSIFNGYKSKNPIYYKWLKQISESNSTSIHVRRGDYVNNYKASLVHEVCDMRYFNDALRIVKKQSASNFFFIFTDDVKWVKAHFKGPEFKVVSSGSLNHFDELSLMSHCHNNIIANSSFSWWGAWLNQNTLKVVISPAKWFKNNRKIGGLIPQSWQVI
jgi:hypothetical protein